MKELSVIQKTHDLIKWYIPILEKLPRTYKFTLGEKMSNHLYDLLEGLIQAKYAHRKIEILKKLNIKLDIIRHQTQLLLEFELISLKRYKYVNQLINEVGTELGGWIKQQNKQ
ncbi:MAG: diversity-generating retroelement protein Avd [Crocosphaera sp.]